MNGDVRLSISTLAETSTDVTTTFTLFENLGYTNPGGRLAVSGSGQVFACVFDTDEIDNSSSIMQLVLMEAPSNTTQADVKVVEVSGSGYCADIQTSGTSTAFFMIY
jgi:hypothetical protein